MVARSTRWSKPITRDHKWGVRRSFGFPYKVVQVHWIAKRRGIVLKLNAHHMVTNTDAANRYFLWRIKTETNWKKVKQMQYIFHTQHELDLMFFGVIFPPGLVFADISVNVNHYSHFDFAEIHVADCPRRQSKDHLIDIATKCHFAEWTDCIMFSDTSISCFN